MTDKLNDNDKARIYKEVNRIFNESELVDLVHTLMFKSAEYATIYEREQQEQLEADIKARNIFIENLEIYNQELISKLQSKCPDEELIKGYTNKIVEVAELKKEIRDTTDIYEKERSYLRELANKKTDESERYAKLVHSNNDKLRQLEAERSEVVEALNEGLNLNKWIYAKMSEAEQPTVSYLHKWNKKVQSLLDKLNSIKK